MADRYFYLIASLPLLKFNSKPLVPFNEFVEYCHNQLSPKDLSYLKSASSLEENLDELQELGLSNEWRHFLGELKNEIAVMRAHKLGEDVERHQHDFQYPEERTHRLIAELKRESNPLEAERMIDEMKWEKLDELSTGHFFDIEAVIIYALRLKIIYRWQHLTKEKGQENLEKCLTGSENR